MVALVAVGLGIGDIILDDQHLHIVLIADHIRDLVNILLEGADDPNPRDIVDIPEHIFHRHLMSLLVQLLHDALRRLDARFHMLNGIIIQQMDKLLTEDIDLGADLL
jgi:hypothetical protein